MKGPPPSSLDQKPSATAATANGATNGRSTTTNSSSLASQMTKREELAAEKEQMKREREMYNNSLQQQVNTNNNSIRAAYAAASAASRVTTTANEDPAKRKQAAMDALLQRHMGTSVQVEASSTTSVPLAFRKEEHKEEKEEEKEEIVSSDNDAEAVAVTNNEESPALTLLREQVSAKKHVKDSASQGQVVGYASHIPAAAAAPTSPEKIMATSPLSDLRSQMDEKARAKNTIGGQVAGYQAAPKAPPVTMRDNVNDTTTSTTTTSSTSTTLNPLSALRSQMDEKARAKNATGGQVAGHQPAPTAAASLRQTDDYSNNSNELNPLSALRSQMDEKARAKNTAGGQVAGYQSASLKPPPPSLSPASLEPLASSPVENNYPMSALRSQMDEKARAKNTIGGQVAGYQLKPAPVTPPLLPAALESSVSPPVDPNDPMAALRSQMDEKANAKNAMGGQVAGFQPALPPAFLESSVSAPIDPNTPIIQDPLTALRSQMDEKAQVKNEMTTGQKVGFRPTFVLGSSNHNNNDDDDDDDVFKPIYNFGTSDVNSGLGNHGAGGDTAGSSKALNGDLIQPFYHGEADAASAPAVGSAQDDDIFRPIYSVTGDKEKDQEKLMKQNGMSAGYPIETLYNTTAQQSEKILSVPPPMDDYPDDNSEGSFAHVRAPHRNSTPGDDKSKELENRKAKEYGKKNDMDMALEEGLAVAVAVNEDDEMEADAFAVEYDPDAKPVLDKDKVNHLRRRIILYGTFTVFVIIIVAIGATVGSNMAKRSDVPQGPTMAPSTYRDTLGIEPLIESIVGSQVLIDDNSPYKKALNWILYDDPAQLTPDQGNLVQRYLAGYFYFATTTKSTYRSCGAPSDPTNTSANDCTWLQRVTLDNPPQYNGVASTAWLTNTSECTWAGLLCDYQGQVLSITLASNNMSGTFPEGVQYFPFLQVLTIGDNAFTGPLSGDIISELSNVVDFEVNFNQFTGTVPSEVWQMTKLNQLTVGNNMLTGTLPTEIGNLVDLLGLYMYQNQFTGTLPTEIGKLNNLYFFWIYSTGLHGQFPNEVANWSTIQWISISNSRFAGTLPSILGKMNNTLANLEMAENSFTGTIPDSLYDLVNIQILDLQRNKLSGTISPKIGTSFTPQFVQLYLSENQFTGTIPVQVANLTAMDFAWFHDNNLVGTMPQAWCALQGGSVLGQLTADCTPGSNGAVQLSCSCCTLCCTADGSSCMNK